MTCLDSFAFFQWHNCGSCSWQVQILRVLGIKRADRQVKDEADTDRRRWIWYGRYRREEERESISLWLKEQSSTHENQSRSCQPMWYCSFLISRCLDDKRWQADRESSINSRRKMLFCCKRTNVKRESRIRVLVLLVPLLHCLDFWDAWKARDPKDDTHNTMTVEEG